MGTQSHEELPENTELLSPPMEQFQNQNQLVERQVQSHASLESRDSPSLPMVQFQSRNELVEGQFQSRNELIEHVRNFAMAQGYVITIKKSATDKFVTLGCDRGGTYRSRRKLADNQRKKQASSRLINCPFEVKGTRRVDGSWTLKIRNQEHNHEASKELPGHSSPIGLFQSQNELAESRESPSLPMLQFQSQNKLVDGQFQSRNELVEHVRNFAMTQGFMISIKKSANDKFVTLGCDRGGTYRSRRKLTDSQRKKRARSRLINCPFEVKGTRGIDGSWTLKIKNQEHNHEVSKALAGHSSFRQFSEEEVSKIREMTAASVRPRQILTTLKQSNPELQVVARDLYNMKAKIRKENLTGRTPIQALLDELAHGGFTYNLNYDGEGCLTHLFFAHPLSIAMSKSYPNVFMMDCIYKTKYKMLLLDIIGVTSFNTSFYSCFAFLRKEEEEDYVWALNMFNDVLGDHFTPRVIVTARDLALMRAVRVVFPTTANLLYARHIDKGIVATCKAQFKDKEDWDAFLSDWATLVDSPFETAYYEAYGAFLAKFKEKQTVLSYIVQTWIPLKEYFVKAWADKHTHFGNRVTSKAEGAHSTLKSYLKVSTCGLHLVKKKICAAIETQFQEIKTQLSVEKTQIPHSCRIPFFDELIGRISIFALKELFKQYELSRNKSMSYLCKNQFTATMGIPCAHMMNHQMDKGEKLHLYDIHSQWRIDNRTFDDIEVGTNKQDDRLENLFEDIRNNYRKWPLFQQEFVRNRLSELANSSMPMLYEPIVQYPSGHQPGSENSMTMSSPRQELSAFEIVEKTRKCGLCKNVSPNSRTCPHKAVSTTISHSYVPVLDPSFGVREVDSTGDVSILEMRDLNVLPNRNNNRQEG